jgi:uncharacterized membrane protein
VSETPRPEDQTPARFWRSFLTYTGSRVGVFVVLLGLLYGIGVRGPIVVLIALVMSGILSYFLLDRQRTSFARALEAHIERRRAAATVRTSREDAIADRLIAEEETRRNVSQGGSRGT